MLGPGLLAMVLMGIAAGSGMGGQAPVMGRNGGAPGHEHGWAAATVAGFQLEPRVGGRALLWAVHSGVDSSRYWYSGSRGTVLGAIAASRIESDRHRRAGALRLWATMSLVVQLFFVYGAVFAPHWRMVGMMFGSNGSQTPIGVFILSRAATAAVHSGVLYGRGHERRRRKARQVPAAWVDEGRMASGIGRFGGAVCAPAACHLAGHVRRELHRR